MRRFLLIAAAWLNIMGLGIWLGAMTGIGALVAPVAFDLAREQAPRVLGESFKRLNYLGLGCAVVVLAGTVIEALAWRPAVASLVRLGLVLAAAGIAGYLGWIVFPEIEALRAAGEKAAFDRLHDHYQQVARVQLLLLVGGTLATAALSVWPGKGKA